MKINASDVAKVFINLFKDEEEGVTNLKLQKLLYYAQGFSFQRFSKPLFEDEIEAWKHGPVVSTVYAQYASYGREPIRNASDIVLDENTENLILDVAREYGKYTSWTLANMTHEKGTPWRRCYIEGQNHTIIPKEVIADYFKNGPKLGTVDWEQLIENGDIVDLTDNNHI